MVEKIIDDYFKVVGEKELVFKYTPWAYYSFWRAFWTLIASGIGLIISYFFSINEITYIGYYAIGFTFIMMISIYFYLVYKAKKICYQQYKIKISKKFAWYSSLEYQVIRDKRLIEYLKKENLAGEKLQDIIDLLKINLKNKRPPWVIPGLFLTFLIPIWSNIISKFMGTDKLNVEKLPTIIVFWLIVVFFVNLTNWYFQNTKKAILGLINPPRIKKELILQHLEIVQVKLRNGYINDQMKQISGT